MDEKKITRRDALKSAALTTAALSLPGISGCTAAVIKNVPKIDYSMDILLKNCNVIDVIKGKTLNKKSIHISRGKIILISKNIEPISGTQTIDMGGLFVIPGMIDTHCHPTISPVFAMRTVDAAKHFRQLKDHYRALIRSGVTTIRDVGAFPGLMRGFLKDIDKDYLIGPRVKHCNSILNIKGGHPEINPTDIHVLADIASLTMGSVMTNFESTAQLKKHLVKNTRGASFIKLTSDNKSVFCRKGTIPVYSDEHLNLIFAFAEKKELPVICHVHRKWGFDRMLKYPIHSLEHMVSDTYLTDKEVQKMSDKKIALSPTMIIGQSYLMAEAYDSIPGELLNDFIVNEIKIRNEYLNNVPHWHCDPHLHKTNMDMLKYYRILGFDQLWKNKKFLTNPQLFFNMIKYGPENLRKMRDAGIVIGASIDAGMPFAYFGGIYRELEFFSRIGFKNDEILRCATINGARILHMDDTIGSLEQGKTADMVFLKKNPLKEVEAYRNPDMVIKEGQIRFSRHELKQNGNSTLKLHRGGS